MAASAEYRWADQFAFDCAAFAERQSAPVEPSTGFAFDSAAENVGGRFEVAVGRANVEPVGVAIGDGVEPLAD